MQIKKTKFKDLYEINNIKYKDSRGFFSEIFNKKLNNFLDNKFNKKINFVQLNFSFSKNKNTLRGLHCQIHPKQQAKLVSCIKGKIIDFVIDVRNNSNTFGKYLSFELSEKNNKMVFVPEGFLHGFLTKTNNCEVIYACTKFYSKKHELNVNFINNKFDIKEIKNTIKYNMSHKDKYSKDFNFNKNFFK